MISSRTLLLSLLALNVFVFLWLMGFLPLTGKHERQPDRLNNQIEPDKLDIVRSDKDKQAAAKGAVVAAVSVDGDQGDLPQSPVGGMPGLGAAASQLARIQPPVMGAESPLTSTTARVSRRPTPAPAVEPAPASLQQCVMFPETDYYTALEQLEQFTASSVTGSLQRLDAGSYLVYLEPFESTTAAQTRRRELVAAGVSNAQVIANGERRNGLSLGLVRTAEQAQLRLRELRLLGVDKASVGPLSTTTSRYRTRLTGDAMHVAQTIMPAAASAGLSLEPCQ